jgi:hypothetical protein
MVNNMPTVRFHHDPDGIISAYFAMFGVKGAKPEPWNGKFGDTTGLQKGDWMVDMRPIQNMEGLNLIDHHQPYPDNHKYKIVSGEREPASYQCWKLWKDKIPKNQWWKLAIGVVGDGQPELIPYEVFEECPELLSKWKTSCYQSYGKWKVSYYPMYKLMSSGVNALMRKAEFDKAMNVLKFNETPTDLLTDSTVIKAKAEVSTEFEYIMRHCKSYEIDHNLAVFVYNSDVRMSGYVASAMQGSLDKTVIAVNGRDGRGSLRGDLALYYRDKLKILDYLVLDGHPGFMGLNISVKPEIFVNDLVRVL